MIYNNRSSARKVRLGAVARQLSLGLHAPKVNNDQRPQRKQLRPFPWCGPRHCGAGISDQAVSITHLSISSTRAATNLTIVVCIAHPLDCPANCSHHSKNCCNPFMVGKQADHLNKSCRARATRAVEVQDCLLPRISSMRTHPGIPIILHVILHGNCERRSGAESSMACLHVEAEEKVESTKEEVEVWIHM